jgi:hypothetical protein
MSVYISFHFAFKNILQILKIILPFLAILAGMYIIMVNTNSSLVAMGMFIGMGILALIYFLFVSGYSTRAIVIAGKVDERMPKLEFGMNLWRGFLITLAIVYHFIPVFLVAMLNRLIPNVDAANRGLIDVGFVWGEVILGVITIIVMFYTFCIAVLRYAAENRIRSLFALLPNMMLFFRNFGTAVGLFYRQVILYIFYSILLGGLFNILEQLYPAKDAERPLEELVAMGAVLFGGLMCLHVTSQISHSHLIGSFGIRLGLMNTAVSPALDDEIYSFPETQV